jgi:hypothetical protein
MASPGSSPGPSARASRLYWESAWPRSPRAACRRIRARWATSWVGASASTRPSASMAGSGSPLLVQRGGLRQQCQVALAQGVPALVRLLLVAVGGQQLPRVEFDGGPVGGGVARAAGGGGSLELLGVHPQGFFGAQ